MTRTRIHIALGYVALTLALGFIAIASILSPARTANVAGASTYYAQYHDDGSDTWMCYICPSTPGGGGGSICGDGYCDADEDANSCSADCQDITRTNSRSNLAQAYDESGYHPGSDCGDSGTWMACPGQESSPTCTPTCSDACGSSDGCGGTCGSQCNSGCPNAGNTSICPVFTCPEPNQETKPVTANANNLVCGAQYGWDGSNYYTTYAPGSVVQLRNKDPNNASISWYCRYADPSQGVNEYSGVDCTTLPGFQGYKANLTLIDQTQGTYTGTEPIFWAVAIGRGRDSGSLVHKCLLVVNNNWNEDSWTDCGGSRGAKTVSGTFNPADIQGDEFADSLNSNIQGLNYTDSVNTIPRYGYPVSGYHTSVETDYPREYVLSDTSSYRPYWNGTPDWFRKDNGDPSQGISYFYYRTDDLPVDQPDFRGPGYKRIGNVKMPPDELVVNGWIPVNNLVYRKSDCTTWGAWYTQSYSCSAPNPKVEFNTGSAVCPSGTAGEAVRITFYSPYSGGAGLTTSRVDNYASGSKTKCFPPPANFNASVSSGTATLTWTPVSGTQTLIKEGGTIVCGPTSATSCTVSGLQTGSSHTYTAYAYDNSQSLSVNGSTVNTGKVITYSDYNDGSGIANYGSVFYNYPTPSAVLGAGTSKTVSIVAPPYNTAVPTSVPQSCGAGYVNVGWYAQGSPTHFHVTEEYSGRVVYDGPDSLNINDYGVTPGRQFYYKVISSNAGGSDEWTSAWVTAPNDCPPGEIPNVSYTINSCNSITVGWNPVSGTNVRYRVTEYGTGRQWDVGSNTNVQVNTPNNNGSWMYYTLTAYNNAGSSEHTSSWFQAPICPVTSTGFTATAPTSPSCGTNWVNLAYYNANAGSSGTYTVKRDGTTISSIDQNNVAWQTDSSGNQYYGFSDTGLSPASSHTYTLSISTAGGTTNANAAPNYPVSVQQICAASNPSNAAATPNSQTQITVSWTDNSSTETGFKVQRSANGSTGWSTITTTAANVTSYPDTGLSTNTTYYYRVISTNAGGDSAPSNTANATTLPNPPAAPTNFTATPGACGTARITLSWTASSGATSYTLKRGTTTIYTGSNTSFDDTSLTANTSYSYTVSASNTGGASSNASVTQTSPADCISLTFTSDSATVKYGDSTMLRWTPANATSCTASNGWNGAKSASGGSQTTGNLSTTTTFTLSCTGASGTIERSVIVSAIPPSQINVNSNLQSAGWTITGSNTSESKTGNGNGNSGQLAPALAGTTYTIAPEDVSGYDFPPSISNSIGGGSSLLLFGGEHESFTINYVRAFNYTLSNGGNVNVEKGGINQFGQVVIHETLAQDSGPTKPVSLSVAQSDGSPLPTGVSASFSTCTPGGQPNCDSTLTFTVTPQAVAGTYTLRVTGSPLGKTTSFNLTIVNSPDMIVSCTHNPLTAKVGDTVTWSVNVTQTPSRAPYTYIWSGPNIPDNTTAQSFDVVYTTTGVKTADVTVRDSLENIAHCSTEGSINISVNPQFQEF